MHQYEALAVKAPKPWLILTLPRPPRCGPKFVKERSANMPLRIPTTRLRRCPHESARVFAPGPRTVVGASSLRYVGEWDRSGILLRKAAPIYGEAHDVCLESRRGHDTSRVPRRAALSGPGRLLH